MEQPHPLMPAFTATMVLAGALAGGFINGLAGFGTGLMALGFWLYVLDPVAAATLVAVCSVVAQAQNIPMIWHAIDRRRVGPMIAAGLLGVPAGTALLSLVDPNLFRCSVGMLLIGFAVFMLLGRPRPRLTWGGRAADSAAGFAGGVLGGLAGLSGPLPTVWATLRGWSKDERRGVFQPFNLVVLAAVVMWHAATGLVTVEFARLAAVALPGTVGGAWVGARAYRRLSEKRFHELLLTLLGVSGVFLVWASL